MKFQNPSLNFFVWTDGHTHGQTDKPNQYAPHFFKVGGIKMGCKRNPSQLGPGSSRPEPTQPGQLGRVNWVCFTRSKKQYVDSLYYCMEIE